MEIARLLRDRLPGDIITCEAAAKVSEAVACLAERRIGAMPVMKDGRVAGIFSERDLTYQIAREREICLARTVDEVMTSPAITVSPSTTVDEAMELMTRRRIRHLPVMEGDTMKGFVSIGDLVKSKMDEVRQEAQAMRQYITTG